MKLKFFRKVTMSEKIDVATSEASEALNMFEVAFNKLESANAMLDQVEEEAGRKIIELQRHVQRTGDEKRMNKAVQARLKDFITTPQA